jgi:hypothetical protein
VDSRYSSATACAFLVGCDGAQSNPPHCRVRVTPTAPASGSWASRRDVEPADLDGFRHTGPSREIARGSPSESPVILEVVGAPRDIHIASKTFQRNWAVNERVFCTRVGEIEGQPKRIDQVGFRPHWWGRDPGVAAEVEQRLSYVEGKVTPFLRDPVGQWPVADDARGEIAVFIALHVVRSPAWRDWHGDQVALRVAEAIREDPASEPLQMEIARRLVSDVERVKTILSQLTKLASGLASMHWSLLRFDDRVLALSDQPVCAVPLSIARGHAPVEVVPASGFFEVLEIRVPISPSIALILSWCDRPEESVVHHGTYDQACSLNASVIAQADRHWIRHPDGTGTRIRPDGLSAIADPISSQLLSGYDPQAVVRSGRQAQARELINDLIDRGVVDYVGWVGMEASDAPT